MQNNIWSAGNKQLFLMPKGAAQFTLDFRRALTIRLENI